MSSSVESIVSGSILSRPELDLNTYYVLALNADATISVVDPLFGYGSSKLLTMVFLKSPGEDWALTADGSRLIMLRDPWGLPLQLCKRSNPLLPTN